MKAISPDAQVFFDTHPGNVQVIKLFLSNFDIQAAHEKYVSNTKVYAYILQPHEYMKDAFGFEKDVLLIYSPYKKMEPRSIQALEELFRKYPYIGRVDTLTCFFLSDDENVETWIDENADTEHIHIIIAFSKKETLSYQNDENYLRNKLRRFLYNYDLFNDTLPLRTDKYFFGRQQNVDRFISAIKRGQNRGIFGLRKTGKTSLLYKIQRVISEQNLGKFFYYDCKIPAIRNLHWTQFMYYIYKEICDSIGMDAKAERENPELTWNFTNAIKAASKKGVRIILFFDEIEYVSFVSPIEEHWKTEFLDFWQTIWNVQSAYLENRTQSNLVCIISGVNASVSEEKITINNNIIQNPLTSILQSEYLTGLDSNECNTMIRKIGRRMGLKLNYEAVSLLFEQYGGHPMLTRLACSQIHMHYIGVDRPVSIGKKEIEGLLSEINQNLAKKFADVIQELPQFYPDEYAVFEMLASGQIVDFLEFYQYGDYTRHLFSYGLLDSNESGKPIIKLPVAAEYVAMELAKKEGRRAQYRLVPEGDRAKWVKGRIQAIIQDLRQLEIVISQTQLPQLFGKRSIPEADKLCCIPVADTESNFQYFLNTVNKCLVESIENYGESKKKKDYFWSEIKSTYPDLFEVLYRAKVYRHWQDHLDLYPQFRNDYARFKKEDTAEFSVASDQFFAIQQRLLDNLIVGIHNELDKRI